MNSTRLLWLNDWCREHSTYPIIRPFGNLTYDPQSNLTKSEWLAACADDLEPHLLMDSLREALRRWHAMDQPKRVFLALVMVANVFMSFLLAITVATFRDMTKQQRPWTKLILSQLVVDNAIVFAGSVSIVELMLFVFTFNGNFMCLATTWNRIVHLISAYIGISVVGAVLSSQFLVLGVLMDRIQGIVRPIAYMAHRQDKRAVRINIFAYTAGFLPLFAVTTIIFNAGFYRRWSGVPEILTNDAAPVTWQDATCYRRLEIASICDYPFFTDAVNHEGMSLSNQSERRYWFLPHSEQNESSLCNKGAPDPRLYSGNLVGVGFFLSIFIGFVVAVASGVLVIVFRNQQTKRNNIVAGPKQDRAHEKAVTVAVLVEAAIIIASSVANTINFLFHQDVSESDSTVAVTESAMMGGLILVGQLLFGSYLLNYILFKSFRNTIIELSMFKWLPKPRQISFAAFLYFAVLLSCVLGSLFVSLV